MDTSPSKTTNQNWILECTYLKWKTRNTKPSEQLFGIQELKKYNPIRTFCKKLEIFFRAWTFCRNNIILWTTFITMKYKSTVCMICDKSSYDAKCVKLLFIDLVLNYYFRHKNTLHLKFRHDNIKLYSSLIMTYILRPHRWCN